MTKQICVCSQCGYAGYPNYVDAGSGAVELFLYLFFLIPGMLYSHWRVSNRKSVCPKCKNISMIPTDSPMGKKLISDLGIGAQITEQQKKNGAKIKNDF